jgi:hypothetical protein
MVRAERAVAKRPVASVMTFAGTPQGILGWSGSYFSTPTIPDATVSTFTESVETDLVGPR